MNVKLSLLAFGLAAAIPLAVAADPAAGPGAGSSSPEMRAQFERARASTRTAVFADLSAEHRAQVQAVVDKVNAGTLTDPFDAVKQIDAILTPDETKAVLAERAKLGAAMHHGASGSAGPPPGGPPPAGAAGMHSGADAGHFILRLAIAPEKLHEMMRGMHDPAGAPPPH